MNIHQEDCSCCRCLKHSKCIKILNPRWTCLMPNRINEIIIGPLDPLQADCLLEVKEKLENPFKIVNKYVYPNYLTRIITLTVISPTPFIIKPGYLLASFCIVTTEQALEEIDGKFTLKNLLLIFINFLLIIYF